MNPYTNKFEKLVEPTETQKEILSMIEQRQQLLRPDGTPVPRNWSIFTEGESVVVKDYTFKVVRIGESYLVLEPEGPVVIGEGG